MQNSDADEKDAIRQTFDGFCMGCADMDGKAFVKLCTDAGLMGAKFTTVDADIIFARVVSKGKRRIDCDQFQEALKLIADRKGVAVAAIQQSVIELRGPSFRGTRAEVNRFYDEQAMIKSDSVRSWGSPPRSPGRQNQSPPRSSSKEMPIRPSSMRLDIPLSPKQIDALRATYKIFCGPGTDGLDGKGFSKLCSDSGLIGQHFAVSEADIVFAKAVPKGQRRMSFEEYQCALKEIAKRKQTTFESVARSLGEVRPVLRGTHAESVRLLDLPKGSPSSTSLSKSSASGEDLLQLAHAEAVAPAFRLYATEGVEWTMDGKSFAKLCADSHLTCSTFTARDADLVFAKTVPTGQRRMTFEEFQVAITRVAKRSGVSMEAVVRSVSEVRRQFAGTAIPAVRLHDDTGTYTGTHRYGGPEVINYQRFAPSSRSTPSTPQKGSPCSSPGRPSRASISATPLSDGARGRDEAATVGTTDDTELDVAVQKRFQTSCFAQDALDGKAFAKLCHECNFIDSDFCVADADLVFVKAISPTSQRRMTFEPFLSALKDIGQRKGLSLVGIKRAVAEAPGPTLRATNPDAVRFHDDTSTYTGTHRYGGPDTSPSRSPKRTPLAGSSSSLGDLSTTNSKAPSSPPGSRLKPRGEADPAAPSLDRLESFVRRSFEKFCGLANDDMDGRAFAKLCTDCQLIGVDFALADADLVFAKVVPVGQRRIQFEHFCDALKSIAQKKSVDLRVVEQAVAEASPKLRATQAESVRLHDDAGTYTGTHRFGGPDTRPAPRSPPPPEIELSGGSLDWKPPTSPKPQATIDATQLPSDSTIRRTFRVFCGVGNDDMDGRSFAKLCSECKLIDSVDADLVFAKAAPMGQRRLRLEHFVTALKAIAERKNMDMNEIERSLVEATPTLRGTQAAPVRFHDDISTYTGTHRYGGPSSRSPSPPPLEKDLAGGFPRKRTSSPLRIEQSLPSPESAVERSFILFCGVGNDDMDGRAFAKLCTDCQLVDRGFTLADADLVFAKAVPMGQRRMRLEHFVNALKAIAERKAVDFKAIEQSLVEVSRTLRATQAVPVRFHDDTSTYTGTHRYGGPDPRPERSARSRSSSPQERNATSVVIHSKLPPSPTPTQTSRVSSKPSSDTPLQRSFKLFSGVGNDNLDSRGFAKLCSDCLLVGKDFLLADVDLVFAQAVPANHRRMGFEHFNTALHAIAKCKGVDPKNVEQAVVDAYWRMVRSDDNVNTYIGGHEGMALGGTSSASDRPRTSRSPRPSHRKLSPFGA